MLRQAPDLLLPAEIVARLKTTVLGKEIRYFSEIGSTNNEAKRLAAEGCPEGLIVVAEAQSTGRGRLARGWFSPFGKGIWLSVVLRPPFHPLDAPKCTLMAAVALTKAIRKVTEAPCGIKWPNDILYEGKKLVGILTEMSAEMDAINYVVIGMGINVNIAPEEFPPELRDIATSVAAAAGRPVSRLALLAEVLAELETVYSLAVRQGFGPVLDEWRKLTITLGQQVNVLAPGETFAGIAVNIDNEGALLVDTGQGVRRILAGDVTIRPRT
ncbi:biotin--acetyl-CoA-carboxylase ligase [Thermosinus carboxydivorans Nor1]|uniref:biotin--[biotin carboxyl-carrier protein] ligase n=1 Tax=Thermosinus carboxydivorans Nor1 TaxID=401526 RepID=A1HRR2_9FIRM|nr:biotin--acetyl-CoA-carboxylase ligase [Thermosinus carboxydivorans Nor1]